MKGRVLVGIIVVLVAVGGMGAGGYLIWRGLHTIKVQGTTDEAKLKGTIRGALDSWLGYSVLDSAEMARRMRGAGYRLDWKDDGADYGARFKAFANGDYDMVVATVDSYVLGGQPHSYPGSIVAVLDESQGDAIIAKDAIKDVNGLDAPNVRIAFTPASPSEFLLKSVGSHFGVPKVRTKGPWRVETNGSSEALKLLLAGKVEAAVLWEPDVSTAKATPGFHYLMGSDKSRRLIVDILIVHKDYLAEHPDVVRTFLKEYFQALKIYRDDEKRLVDEVAEKTKKPPAVIQQALTGVRFASFTENCEEWLGLPTAQGGASDEGLVDTIDTSVRILTDEGDLKDNPLPNGNSYALMTAKPMQGLLDAGFVLGGPRFQGEKPTASAAVATADLPPLDDAKWAALRTVGSLKLRPILFQSGTAVLTTEGKTVIDEIAETLDHYPNFRIELRGHTAPGGDEEANKTLSQDRAEAVARYLELVHKIDPDAMRSLGLGSTQPLQREPDEADRAYRYRLPRVEFVLKTEVI